MFDGKPIPYSHNVRFLGVQLDPKLSWKNHITTVRNKLASVSGILSSIRPKIIKSTAKLLYYTLAYPHFTYANVLWTSTAASNLKPLIVMQKRLIRIITKRGWIEHTDPLFSELKLLKFSDLSSLSLALFVYKTVNNLIQSPITFTPREEIPYNLRNVLPLLNPQNQSNQTRLFVESRGKELWNRLPNQIKESNNPLCLKNRLKSYFISNYG